MLATMSQDAEQGVAVCEIVEMVIEVWWAIDQPIADRCLERPKYNQTAPRRGRGGPNNYQT
jgi:hypothetical protein